MKNWISEFLTLLPGIIILAIFVLLPPLGAALIAQTICPPQWKEKHSKARVVGFISIFFISLAALFVLMTMASTMVFGR